MFKIPGNLLELRDHVEGNDQACHIEAWQIYVLDHQEFSLLHDSILFILITCLLELGSLLISSTLFSSTLL